MPVRFSIELAIKFGREPDDDGENDPERIMILIERLVAEHGLNAIEARQLVLDFFTPTTSPRKDAP